MQRSNHLFVAIIIMAVIINLGITGGASAKAVKVGAVINLTGPASTWGQVVASIGVSSTCLRLGWRRA